MQLQNWRSTPATRSRYSKVAAALLRDLPQVFVTADEQAVVRDCWCGEDRFAQLVLADDFAFRSADVDDLTDAGFIEEDQVFARSNRCGAERPFQAQSPEEAAGTGVGTLQDAGAIDDEQLVTNYDRAGCGGAQFVVFPQFFEFTVARTQYGQSVGRNQHGAV